MYGTSRTPPLEAPPGTPAENWMLVGLLVFIAAVCILPTSFGLIYNADWIRKAHNGPQSITLRELRQLKNPDKLATPLVQFTYEEAVDTDVGLGRRRFGEQSMTTRFVFIRVEDRFLLAQIPVNHQDKTVEGEVAVWTSDKQRDAIAKATANRPEEKRLMLPFVFDAHTSYRSQCFSMVLFCAVVILIGVALLMWAAFVALKQMLSPTPPPSKAKAPEPELDWP